MIRVLLLCLSLLTFTACTGSPESRKAKLDAAIEMVNEEIKAFEPFMGSNERLYVGIAREALLKVTKEEEFEWKTVFDAMAVVEPAVREALEKQGMKPEEVQFRISAFRSALRAVQLLTIE